MYNISIYQFIYLSKYYTLFTRPPPRQKKIIFKNATSIKSCYITQVNDKNFLKRFHIPTGYR